MTLGDALVTVWQQVLAEGCPKVELEQESYPVNLTRAKKLRTVRFRCWSYWVEGIEQNPATGSRWAQLARQGKRVMQFRSRGRYIGNVCEGQLLRYPAWRAFDLSE